MDEFEAAPVASIEAALGDAQGFAALKFDVRLDLTRVIFGIGAAKKASAMLVNLGCDRAAVVCSPAATARHAEWLAALASHTGLLFAKAEPHCPERVVEQLRADFRAAGLGAVIAIGGGSTLGLGKILAAEEDAKFIAVPTTYCGSEMTSIYGRKIGQEKRTKVDSGCLPDVVLYDPSLTIHLPRAITTETGMNSLAHSTEALFTDSADAETARIAEAAIRALMYGVRGSLGRDPGLNERAAALVGGFLGGRLISRHGIALHHQLCHVLGGVFDLPHGVSNAAALSHAIAYNEPAAPQAVAALRQIFGAESPSEAIDSFAREVGAPVRLAEFGLTAADAPAIVEKLMTKKFFNPRPLERDPLIEMVRNIIDGAKPRLV